MPKILYIEDDLTNNIATIKKFFAPILNSKRIYKELEELENRDRDATLYPEDIISACRHSSILDIAHTFPIALERIINNHKSYDLILIDRNLSIYNYSDDLVQILFRLSELGMDYDALRLDCFKAREGDLLLLVLLRLNPEYKNKVYYLTANTKDDLRISSDLLTTLDLGNYQKDHIIEKGFVAESTISNILADMDSFRIQNNYRRQCDIIRKRLQEEDVSQFIEMISYYEKDKRREFVMYLRKLLDNILHDIAFSMADPEAEYWNPQNKKQLTIKSFIKGFKSRNSNTFVGLPGFDEKHHIGYNSIIRNACLSIFEICSDCGVHDLSKAIDIESLNTDSLSSNTLISLLFQMKDVIIWYDKALDLIR